MRSGYAALALIGLAIAAAGCGGDSAPSKAAFIEEADAVCAKADTRQQVGIERGLQAVVSNPPKTVKAGRELLVKYIGLPPLQSEAQELEALEPPSGDEKRIHQIVKEIERAVDEGGQRPLNVLKKPGQNTFAKAEKLARSYGLKTCGAA